MPSINPRFLSLALLLAAGCTTLDAPKLSPTPAPRVEEAPAKKVEKIEEPSVKKPEPAVTKKGEQELSQGIHEYEEGRYKNAAGHFQNALDEGLASSVNRLVAHKYLAFIYCISGEKLACRNEFRQVLRINPKFSLPPSEAGHPIWGPVFSAVKGEEKSRKSSKDKVQAPPRK